MQRVTVYARVILGLIFIVFSSNYLLDFIKIPEPTPEGAAFLGALAATGYMLPTIKLVEFVSGLMLVTGLWTPLGLALLAPIIVNIFLYHVFLDTGGLPLAIVILVLELFLAFAYKDEFKEMLAMCQEN